MTTADRLLSAAAVTIDRVDPLDEEAIASLQRYFDELDERFDTGFDAGDSITADADSYRPPNGAFVLGRHGDEAMACGAVHRFAPDVAEIKRMWVSSDWRRVGLGRRVLEHLEHEGRSLGCTTVRLDTNSVLTEAIAMYRSAGYQPIERYNDNPFARCWFEKRL